VSYRIAIRQPACYDMGMRPTPPNIITPDPSDKEQGGRDGDPGIQHEGLRLVACLTTAWLLGCPGATLWLVGKWSWFGPVPACFVLALLMGVAWWCAGVYGVKPELGDAAWPPTRSRNRAIRCGLTSPEGDTTVP
jgi:hypothetical protein